MVSFDSIEPVMVETRASQRRAPKDKGTQASNRRTPLPTSHDAQLAQSPQPETNTVSRLTPFLITLQETQRKILQLLADKRHRVPCH